VFAGQVRAAKRDSDQFRAAGGKGVPHQLRRRELPRAHQQARMKLPACDN